jgi:hypothetical protein
MLTLEVWDLDRKLQQQCNSYIVSYPAGQQLSVSWKLRGASCQAELRFADVCETTCVYCPVLGVIPIYRLCNSF